MPKVVFARINRRTANPTLEGRSFRDDMTILAGAGELEIERAAGTKWIAADLEIDASGDFMTGIIGFSAEQHLRNYASEVRSWKKGPMRTEVGASRSTLVPFAIDIRDSKRWIAFAPASRIKARGFALAFENLLAKAVSDLRLMAAGWDVDLIPARSRIYEWIEEHPDVKELDRLVKLPNPGIDLKGERERMQQIGSVKKYERYIPGYAATLNLRGEEREVIQKLLEGLEQGDIELTVKTRSGSVYKSNNEIEEATVDDWSEDWGRAVELVLEALRRYVEGMPRQETLPEDDGG